LNWSQLSLIGRRVRNSIGQLVWTHLLTSFTIAMTLFVFGAFMLAQQNLEALLRGWGEQLQINAYLETNLSADDVQSLQNRIGTYPEIARVRYISQQQAWKDFQTALGAQSSVLEGLPRDVLPASFEIGVKPNFRDSPVVQALAARLQEEKGIASVEYAQDWLDRISLAILAVRWSKWIFGGVLFLTTYFIVGNTVKLAILARKEEIEIMQLVGASESLIEAPFVVEGMIQGVIGGGLSMGALWFAFQAMRNAIPATAALLGFSGSLKFLDLQGMALVVTLGWILGAAGSVFSLRRFLRTWK
jgi:cell division transport system permease protein